MTTLPKTSLLPALVAGFLRVLILARPGMVNTPLLFTCSAAMVARLSRICEACFLFSSQSPAIASRRAPFFMAAAFIAFMAFMGAILSGLWGEAGGRQRRSGQ